MSKLSDTILLHIKAYGLDKIGGFTVEYKFHPTRKFRFDFAWPEKKIAFEAEGGAFSGKNNKCPMCQQPPRSRHTTGVGMSNDCIKYNEASILGWQVLRGTVKNINDGDSIDQLLRILGVMG